MYKTTKEQKFEDTLAAETVKVCKLVQQQEQRPEILCEGVKMENVFRFKYLGTIFTADSKQKYDIKTRIVKDLERP